MPEPAPKPGAHEPPAPSLSFAPIRDPRLKPRDCQVLWALCYWAWGRKPNCWPTNAQVAELVGCSVRTIVFAMGRLVAAGYLERTMVRSDRGWYRSLVFTDRVPRPPTTLSIVEPPAEGGGRAIPCATGRAIPVDTPAPGLARPPAQPLAREAPSENQKEKKELAAIVGPQGSAPTPPAGEPEWLRLDNQTPESLDFWREQVGQGGPFAKVARKILERWEEREARKPPESPAKNTRGASIEGSDPVEGNGTKDGPSSQYESSTIEHKAH